MIGEENVLVGDDFVVMIGEEDVLVGVSEGLVVEPVGDPVVVTPSVDPGDGVVDAGPASHSSSTVAAPESTDLKQYSWLSGASCLNSPC